MKKRNSPQSYLSSINRTRMNIGILNKPVEQATLRDLIFLVRSRLNPATVITDWDLNTSVVDDKGRYNTPFPLTVDGLPAWVDITPGTTSVELRED